MSGMTRWFTGCFKWVGCYLLLGGVLLLLIRLLVMREPDLDERAAYKQARRAISSKIPAPATSTFPAHSAPGVQINQNGVLLMITSYVDIQNGSGTLSRKKWIAMVYAEPKHGAKVLDAMLIQEAK